MEFIRVSTDGWNFEKAPSGERFVPFGSNMIFKYPLDIGWGLHILTEENWDPDTIHKVFEGARALNMNVLKVFLTSNRMLPDPQTHEKVAFGKMVPPFLERLDALFQVARETNLYVSLTFAEWGVHSLKWWQEGGAFIGRQPEDGPGVDSYTVFRTFWRTLAERYKDEPALFSYNMAVEFYMPGDNWGAQKSPKESSLLNDRQGLPAWHTWLIKNYGTLDALNKAWGTRYKKEEELPQPEIEFVDEGNCSGHYTMSQAMLADYNSFKECVTYRFLKNQFDAIRSVDRQHMISCGFHPHQPGIGWMGSARYSAGIVCKELDFLDYITTHLYTNPEDNKPGMDAAQYECKRRDGVINARFMYAGKPVVIEEMGHIVTDREETTRETIHLVEALRGHASGFMLWYLSDLDPDKPFGPLGEDLKPNAFGEAWAKLAEPAGLVAKLPRERTPARTVIELDRLNGLAPRQKTEAQTLVEHWDDFCHPVDFEWPLNPMVRKIREGR